MTQISLEVKVVQEEQNGTSSPFAESENTQAASTVYGTIYRNIYIYKISALRATSILRYDIHFQISLALLYLFKVSKCSAQNSDPT